MGVSHSKVCVKVHCTVFGIGWPMRRPLFHSAFLVASWICMTATHAEEGPLQLKQTIPLPSVEGRLDHMEIDAVGERLFVCALGNNTVEVFDLRKGERVHSLLRLFGIKKNLSYEMTRHREIARRKC